MIDIDRARELDDLRHLDPEPEIDYDAKADAAYDRWKDEQLNSGEKKRGQTSTPN